MMGQEIQPESQGEPQDTVQNVRINTLDSRLNKIEKETDTRFADVQKSLSHQFRQTENRADLRHADIKEMLIARFDSADKRHDDLKEMLTVRFDNADARRDDLKEALNIRIDSTEKATDSRFGDLRQDVGGLRKDVRLWGGLIALAITLGWPGTSYLLGLL